MGGGGFTGLVEGAYVETVEGLIFSVKGLSHPEGLVVAYLRYVPDPGGERVRGPRRYRRVYDLKETDEFLRVHHSVYLNQIEGKGLTLQSVPVDLISRVYSPAERLRELGEGPSTELEASIAGFASALSSESRVSLSSLGVSGSALIGLAGPNSDIDIVVYGLDAGLKVYGALSRLREEGSWIRPYDNGSVMGVVSSRWGDTGFDLAMFVPSETRKVLHGLVGERDYFVRLVPSPLEMEAEVVSRPLGRAVLRATVVDSERSIYTPCTYLVGDCSVQGEGRGPEVTRLVSYRGKFTEQAREGEVVEARGTLEEVEYRDRTTHRLMMGGRGDYLILACMLDR
jgi:predicted nucleotidyltransferase